MLLEIAEPLIGAASGIAGYLYFKSRSLKKKKQRILLSVKVPNANGAWPWLYRTGQYSNTTGFYCPKCNECTQRDSYAKPAWQKLCTTIECVDSHEEHFHFQCSNCDVKLIMLPADHPHSLEQNNKFE